MTHFESFNFNKALLKTIKEAGFTSPTPIQNEVIPHVILGKDIIAKAQTGSGKTAAFCLPILHLLAQHPEKKVLILAPTRELALQVCAEMQIFSSHLKITPVAIYGGEPITKQIQRLKADNRILVATPGRLLDHFRSKNLRDFAPSILVLDEADEMLNMGFLEDIQKIFSFLPKERQTLLFSATLPQQIKNLSKKFLKEPLLFDHSSKEKAHEDIHQVMYLINEEERKLALVQTLQFHAPLKSIIFCNTKKQVEDLSNELSRLGFPILRLHGDMTQRERISSIDLFRKSPKKILIATDVAGRGINVTDVSYVFNYELPYSAEGYTHRIGRTGRAGNKGTAVTFISRREVYSFKKILNIKTHVEFSELPSMEDIKTNQQQSFVSSIDTEAVHSDAAQILESMRKQHSLEEISLRLISKFWKEEPVLNTSGLLLPKKEKRQGKKPFKKRHNSRRPAFKRR